MAVQLQQFARYVYYEKIIYRQALQEYNAWYEKQNFEGKGTKAQTNRLIRFSKCEIYDSVEYSMPSFVVTCGGVRSLENVKFRINIDVEDGYKLICVKDLTPLAYQVVRRQFNDKIKEFQGEITARALNIQQRNRATHLSEFLDFALRFFRDEWNSGFLDRVWKSPKSLLKDHRDEYQNEQSASQQQYDNTSYSSTEESVTDGGFTDVESMDGANSVLSEITVADDLLSTVEKILKRSRITLDFEGLAQAQSDLIFEVMEALNIGKGSAAVALRHFRWSKEKLLQVTENKEEFWRVLRDAGIVNDSKPHNIKIDPFTIFDEEDCRKFQCPVCFDEFTVGGMMECGHKICLDCWRNLLKASLLNGGPGDESVLDLTCPGISQDFARCELIVKQEVFESILSPVYKSDVQDEKTKTYGVWIDEALYGKYERAFVSSFVDENDDMFWCPNPKSCGYALVAGNGFTSAKCQSCQFLSCLTCSHEAHEPATCEHARKWLDMANSYQTAQNEDQATSEQDANKRLVKPCPNPTCTTPTEKVSGCMHLTCANCKCSWCWMCGDYGAGFTGLKPPHHVFNCNVPPSEEWNSSVSFKDDGRFKFYYERYQNHWDARMFAEKKRVEGKAKSRELLSKHKALSENDVHFVNDAYEILFECRHALSWTYVLAYFIEDELKRDRFQFTQLDLENRVEEFSKQIEENDVQYLLNHRLDIYNKTTTLAKYLRKIIES